MRERVTRAVWGITALAIASGLVGTAVFVCGTIGVRVPYWGEAEVLFEAARIRDGLPLFVDPVVGGAEYGAPPSRWFVTYPPLVSPLLALVPASAALLVGRILATLAWFGALAWLALSSRRECRANALAGAAFVAGIWVLANFAMTARPDSFACALAAVGLGRAVRSGKIDPISAVLLALAPCVKPNVVGVPAGAFLADALVRRSPWSIVVGAATAGAVVVALLVVSGGALGSHLLGGMGQPLSLAVWLDRVPSRLPFFAPLFALALAHGLRARREPGILIGLGALIVGLVWVLVAIAKTGSAANYWMEPALAAVALVAHAPGSFDFGRSPLAHAVAALAAVLYAESASVPASFGRLAGYRREAALVARARARCGAGPGDAVAAGDPGVELAANGRILATSYQLAWAVRLGRFPSEVWVRDLEAPNVRCYVRHGETTAEAPAVDAAIARLFEPVEEEGELVLLRRR